MKIGLIDVDSHRWPNLCLMKLSAFHKAQGDIVEWWTPEGRYDIVYKSRVFTDTYSKDTTTVTNADRLICGGTGYGPGPDLPDAVEHSRPDYGLYPQFLDTAYGFLTRGCPNRCGFCKADWIIYEGAHDAIISKADFDRVQEIIRQRSTPSRGTPNSYPLKGLLKCGKADHPPAHREVSLEEAIYIIQRQGYLVTAPPTT